MSKSAKQVKKRIAVAKRQVAAYKKLSAMYSSKSKVIYMQKIFPSKTLQKKKMKIEKKEKIEFRFCNTSRTVLCQLPKWQRMKLSPPLSPQEWLGFPMEHLLRTPKSKRL